MKHLAPLTRPALTGTQGIFAQKRKGKSYTAQTQAEDWLEETRQLAVIDPTGAWWGLRSSADGTKPGYPITIFGGEHAVAPLEVKAGALIAEAMVTEGFSAVLDLSLLDAEDWPIVAADFLDTIFKLNRKAMHVIIDEVDEFAPQTTEDKAQQKSRRIVNRLVRRGGKNGTGVTVITQRTALLDKSILSSCDTVVALQMNGAGDIKSLREWLVNHASKEKVDEITHSLGKLPRGQAWVMSPGSETFALMSVRAKRTFDSGRTAEEGDILEAPKSLAPVDVKRLGAAIAATVEKAKANDPVALKARVAQLEQQLASGGKSTSAPQTITEIKIVEKRILTAAELDRIESAVTRIETAKGVLESIATEVSDALVEVSEGLADAGTWLIDAKAAIDLAHQLPPSGGATDVAVERDNAPKPAKRKAAAKPRAPPAEETDPKSPAAEVGRQAIVDALRAFEAIELPATVTHLAAWLGLHPKTRSLLTNLGTLRTDGLLDGMQLTPTGRAGAAERRPTPAEVRATLLVGLSDSQVRVLDTIATFAKLGRSPSHAALAVWLGIHPKTRSLLEDLGKLRSRGYLDGNTLTEIGRRASTPKYIGKKAHDLLAPLDESQRLIGELVLKHGEIPTMNDLASKVGLHPKTRSLLTDLGVMRSRGMLTNGWPLKATDVFQVGAA